MAQDLEYWGGATWVYHATITNDSDGSGDIIVDITPGVGNEMEVLYGQIINGDTATRTCNAEIEDASGNVFAIPQSASTSAGSNTGFPSAANSTVTSRPRRFILSGTQHLILTAVSIAASQDASFACVARIRGGVPTVTETGNGTSPTITVNIERVE